MSEEAHEEVCEEAPKFKVGDLLDYTRVSGEVVTARVTVRYDWEEAPPPPWPKPRHCRFLYRMDTAHGVRTVCECRLRPVVEREIVRPTDLGAGGAPVGPPVLGPATVYSTVAYRPPVPWLLCLTGYAGTGKDTVANLLIEADPNIRRVALADAVKAMTGRLYGLPEDVEWWEKHKGDAWGSTVTLAGRPGALPTGILTPPSPAGTLRDLLIHVGTTCLRDFDPEFWLRMALKRAAELRIAGHPVVITDARFENEIRAFKAVGATCIRLTRPGTEPKGEADLAVDRVPVELFDAIHANDGDLVALRMWARGRTRPRRG